MLLHTVVTHSSEEKNLKFVATVRAGVLNRVSFEILNYAVPRELCRWPTVCPRMDTSRLHDFVRHQSCLIKCVWEYLRAARWENTLCHVHTHMTFSTANCCFNNVCWNTCARYAGRAHFVTYRLSWVCKEPLASSVQSCGPHG